MTTTPDIDPRTDRIIQVAMELAEADGYDAVRLRDVAARADVALGTVYRRFSGKEDILAAALERMVGHYRDAVMVAPVPGDTPEERIGVFIELASQMLGERPKLAAALFRTVASGVPDLAERVTRYRDHMNDIVVLIARGVHRPQPPTPQELQLARMVQNSWFAEMVGWTGGLQTVEEAVDQVHAATRVALEALEIS